MHGLEMIQSSPPTVNLFVWKSAKHVHSFVRLFMARNRTDSAVRFPSFCGVVLMQTATSVDEKVIVEHLKMNVNLKRRKVFANE